MSIKNTSAHLQLNPDLNDGEINLRQVYASLLRQKVLIGCITITATLFSGLYAFTRKPVWEGSFQIVLENQNSETGGSLNQLIGSSSMLSNLAERSGGSGSSLQTEVTILKSPSVLKPVYDFVRTNKTIAGENVSEWKFTSWVNSLSISLVKGTSVLNLSYQDTDKTLVLPVLEKITNTYQEYSGLDRQRGLIQGVEYLEQQLIKFEQQSDRSMRAAQAYALNNKLGIQDGLPASASSNNSSVEGGREAAQNKVNALRQQISAAQNSGDATLYQAPQITANAGLYSQLQSVEALLKEKSALLTQRDQSIQALQRQRASLIAYINQQTIGLLQGELLTAEAELASLTRPREVLLRHRELVSTALRDEKLVADIQTQLQAVRLDQARQTEPWELISTPTLLDHPVAPRKKEMIGLGLLGGLILGCGVGLFRDHQTGMVFSEDELKKLVPYPILARLPAAATNMWTNTAHLLVKGPLANAESVALIPVGNLAKDKLKHLSKVLQDSLGHRQLILSSDLLASRNCSTQLLVTAPGAPQREQLKQLRTQLALQGTQLEGWLLIDPEMEA